MDEKTEELRELFIDVTDEEAVTESQEEARGSLTEDEQRVDDQLESVIARMREQYEFRTDLSDADLRKVVRGFFEGEADTAIAERLDVSRRTVVRARLDLQLLRDSDTEAPFDLDAFQDMLVDERSTSGIADAFDVSESTVRRYRDVIEARNEARRVSDRYRHEFEETLPDTALSARHTDHVKEDGLDEATEGMESNVSM